ncbi:hypothetical protein F8388_019548 [Cannabis sativa]|uniref:Uncharacterized protein n=1 Tax=Cannabis sativa TaxID=3483 RepID=A0A7J6FF42_CANSA|nr:hypothetical protein F8388_019548 [Cannabis sativa]KAF4384419.1 hypothetical protein G4B88_028493 [Cannabis sativa]
MLPNKLMGTLTMSFSNKVKNHCKKIYSLVNPLKRRNINSLTPDHTSRSNTSGIFSTIGH